MCWDWDEEEEQYTPGSEVTYTVTLMDSRDGTVVTDDVTIKTLGSFTEDFQYSGHGHMAKDMQRAAVMYGPDDPRAKIEEDPDRFSATIRTLKAVNKQTGKVLYGAD